MSKLAWLAIPLLLFGALIAACGGGGEETIDLGDGDEVTVSEDLPDNFPDDFPVYDGADVLGSISGEQEGQEGTVVSWETDDDIEDVEAFYKSEFEDGPWTTTSEGSFGGLGNFTVENGDTAAYVLISETDGKTTIVVTYGSKDDLGVDDGSSSGDDDDSSSDDGPSSDDDGSTSDNGDEDTGDDGDSSGSAELPDEVDLNEDYPEDEIPLPDNARVTNSSSFASGGSQSIFTELYVESTVDEVADYYKSTLEGAGYAQGFETNSDGEVFMSYSKDADNVTGDGVLISVTPAEVDGYVLVSVTVSSTSAEQ